jgi:hypothetical protein
MNTIFDKPAYENLIKRLNQLSPEAERLWGKMTPNQMLCHLTDPLRDIMGIRQMEAMLPPAVQQQVKAIVFGESEWEHNQPSLPPYSQDADGMGTKPTNFEQDKKTLADLLNRFYNTPIDYTFHPHAVLNVLSREEFGVYVWRHTDYHLRQFGT